MSQSGSSARDSGESTYRRQDSIGSYYSEKDKDTPRDSQSDERRKLLGSHESNHKSHHPKHHAPTVNLYTHCGRHTDQYLFGGWSNIFKKH
ncbi:hypothetical protein F4815DRAFT_157157 [Daldinia loculata]|uniref:uncharacterized protein n=1 Tax=Daldinia loculata TaxID=103429 RepID=UPI0020C3AA60|nr:uncharacterized protein F4817DRAFT_321439 [Daldinia loculata]KAI1641804.1 hypothetical protein F4817DRAFT_321439 [Daldinia loculata]KAI2780039.1 hypothetical protein F4815DRAFT_157157 [Daldinia loculata]